MSEDELELLIQLSTAEFIKVLITYILILIVIALLAKAF